MSPTSVKPNTPWHTAKCYLASCRRAKTLMVLVSLVLIAAVLYYKCYKGSEETFIVVITPTHKRRERLADMTRFSQTLMHLKNMLWVVVEDGNETSLLVSGLLNRTHIPYVYLHSTTEEGYPKRGWSQRNLALEFLRTTFRDFKGKAVVYFADDDNAYDLRVFDYIRQVETIGLWAVGLAGQALVEAPHVENDTITGWDVFWKPKRQFGTDMAGFAVNFRLILNTTANFRRGCAEPEPENCFLSQLGVPKEKAQAFGHDSEPKELLVWHTKTSKSNMRKLDDNGYAVES